VAACSVTNLEGFIADAVGTSRKYWIASILIGAVVMGLEAYQKRWSIILALTVALLIFHPHLTVRPLPGPSCEFASVQASQAVLAVLVMVLVYRVVKMLASRRTAEGTSA
jgi:predicted cobalt transporter CbtA